MKALWLAWRGTTQIVTSQRKLWLPFLVVAVAETLFVGLIGLAPQPPFSRLLAPPIHYLFGERVLHYPWHLWFLYHAMTYTHLAASILMGAFMTGIACVMVRQTYTGELLSLRAALISRQVRYGTVLAVWLVTWGVARGLMEAASRMAPKTPSTTWVVAGLTFAVVLQALFAYAIPAAVFEQSRWWNALAKSLREAMRYPASTLAMVAVPSSLVLLASIIAPSGRVARWMAQTAPEIALLFVAGRLVIWTVADAVMTVGVAHLWWIHRTPASPPEPTGAVSIASVTPQRGARSLTGLASLLLAALIVQGCSASYNGERLYWRAEQRSAALLKDPRSATPEQFADAIQAFEAVSRATPGTLWSAKAHLAIGSLYAMQRQYADAREAYGLVLRNESQQQDLCLTARVAIAKTYEAEDKWEEAVQAYKDVSDFHPWTRIGMEAPVYVGWRAEQRKQPVEATQAYHQAVERYARLIPEAPTAELAAQMKGYLVAAYQQLGQWDRAIEVLEGLASAKAGANRPLTLLTLGKMYQTKVGRPEKAMETYTVLIEEFPDHPLAQKAREQLAQLKSPAGQSTAAPNAAQPDAAQAVLPPAVPPTPPTPTATP